MLKRILVGLDGSACANHAFAYALGLAKAEAAALYLCSVIASDGSKAAAEDALAAAMHKAMLAGIPVGKQVTFGEPGPTIVACAAETCADTIVVGTHGNSGFKRLFMGSVAEYVLRSAPCPVVTVREPIATEGDRIVPVTADENAPVCAMRLIEVAPADFDRLYGEIATFMCGPGARLSGIGETEVLGSEDHRRIAIIAHFASRRDWVHAQWDSQLGELLAEIASNAETLEFDLFRGDRFARA